MKTKRTLNIKNICSFVRSRLGLFMASNIRNTANTGLTQGRPTRCFSHTKFKSSPGHSVNLGGVSKLASFFLGGLVGVGGKEFSLFLGLLFSMLQRQ